MLRVVRCILHRHCHYCQSHWQTCRCRIHHSYFAASAENLCWGDACGGGAGSGGGDVVSSLHTGICVIGAFRFAGFISPSGNCCPLNHESWPPVFLVNPAVRAMLLLITLFWYNVINNLVTCTDKATASWNVVHCHPRALRIKVNNLSWLFSIAKQRFVVSSFSNTYR